MSCFSSCSRQSKISSGREVDHWISATVRIELVDDARLVIFPRFRDFGVCFLLGGVLLLKYWLNFRDLKAAQKGSARFTTFQELKQQYRDVRTVKRPIADLVVSRSVVIVIVSTSMIVPSTISSSGRHDPGRVRRSSSRPLISTVVPNAKRA